MDYELEILRDAVERAGARALELASQGFETYTKKDRSPVTSADLEVNRILHDRLLTSFPDDGWLSEESQDDPRRLDKKRVWIVDPIDGTKYFMSGVSQYAISAALVEAGQPVVAAVFNPATGEFFSAIRGKGVWLNGAPLRASPTGGERLVVLVSPPAFRRGRFQAIESFADVRPMGSIAYTLALVAAGRATGTVNLDRLHEWDIAAGVLLIEEAGGTATDKYGNAILFNQPKPAVPGIVAAGPGAQEAMAALASRL